MVKRSTLKMVYVTIDARHGKYSKPLFSPSAM